MVAEAVAEADVVAVVVRNLASWRAVGQFLRRRWWARDWRADAALELAWIRRSISLA